MCRVLFTNHFTVRLLTNFLPLRTGPETRTLTERGLNPHPLPIGVHQHVAVHSRLLRSVTTSVAVT